MQSVSHAVGRRRATAQRHNRFHTLSVEEEQRHSGTIGFTHSGTIGFTHGTAAISRHAGQQAVHRQRRQRQTAAAHQINGIEGQEEREEREERVQQEREVGGEERIGGTMPREMQTSVSEAQSSNGSI